MSGIEPNGTFEYDVDADAGDDRPHRVLIARHGTARHWLRYAARVKAIRASDDPLGEPYVADLESAIAGCLVGWRGIDAPFDATPLGEVFQVIELEHIAETLPLRARIGEYEKKASWLRSLTSSDGSATGASPAGASAADPVSPAPGSSARDAKESDASAAADAADGS